MSAKSSAGQVHPPSGLSCCDGRAWLREPMPASSRQILWVPIYPSPAELIEKRYVQDTKALFFFPQKNISIYTREQNLSSFPPRSFGQVELLLDTCAGPYLQATASLDSTLLACSASPGVRTTSLSLWSSPCWLFSLTGLYLQQQPGSGRFPFIQPSLRAWREAQDGGSSTLGHF